MTAENAAATGDSDTTAIAPDAAASDELDGESDDAGPVVSLDSVTFGYTSTPVVEDVTVDIDPGEYVAIVGPNGSGKSTLMKLLLGLLEPDSGTVDLFGHRASDFDDGTRVGYVAQQADATTGMPITVREVVRMGRFPHVGYGFLGSEDTAAVDHALETVGMTDFADRRLTELSGGQRQRAFIARALAGEADLLVLDEPTVGVDAESVEAFYDLLDDLNDDGITVVLVEHDLSAVTEHAERILCMNRTMYFDGPSSEFVESDALARAFGTAAGFLGGEES